VEFEWLSKVFIFYKQQTLILGWINVIACAKFSVRLS